MDILFLGPLLIGVLADHYGSFTYPFYYAAASFGMSCLFYILSEVWSLGTWNLGLRSGLTKPAETVTLPVTNPDMEMRRCSVTSNLPTTMSMRRCSTAVPTLSGENRVEFPTKMQTDSELKTT